MVYNLLDDKEIEDKIKGLTPFQREIFDCQMQHVDDRRLAVFIAKSYPDDAKCKGG